MGESFLSEDGCNTCNCFDNGQIACTRMACAPTPTIYSSPSVSKTNFQKLITDWSNYQEINITDRQQFTNQSSFWTGSIKTDNLLYGVTQKIIQGSIKKLALDNNTTDFILGDYEYKFYITPNYENWSINQKINIESTGIGDLSLLKIYPDKLVWTTAGNCGGRIGEPGIERESQLQCEKLTQEMKSVN